MKNANMSFKSVQFNKKLRSIPFKKGVLIRKLKMCGTWSVS